jgi:hypothetical protein
MVGCCLARLLARFPGVDVELVDIDDGREDIAARLGVRFASPAGATGDRDLVLHASATAAGLQRSLDLLRPEGTVVELSWYGDREVTVALGGAFHSRRLSLRASQVGTVAPARRGARSTRHRLALALDLLRDQAFDALLTSSSPFAELPEVPVPETRTTVPLTSHVRAGRSRMGLPSPLRPYPSARASPIRQPVASIQSTMSGRSRLLALSLPRNRLTSRPVSSTVRARGDFFPVEILAPASRTWFTATASSWMARENMPERHARVDFAAPGPLLVAMAVRVRLIKPDEISRRRSCPRAGLTCLLTIDR